MTTPAPLTPQQLDEIETRAAHLAEYAKQTGEADQLAGVDVPALIAEVRRLNADLAEYEVLNPQQCPAGKHADWLVDSEHTHACPWCEIDRLKGAAEETHVVADDSDDPEHIDDCPGCTLPA